MNLIQEGIYNKCGGDQQRMFWYLIKDNFANAKAFWGERNTYVIDETEKDPERFPFWCLEADRDTYTDIRQCAVWEYQLQLMILSDNPLDYMKKSVSGERR